MLNLTSIANRKKLRINKVDTSYNKNFSQARMNLEVLIQEEKFNYTRELLESLRV